jgi:hypothetical protein
MTGMNIFILDRDIKKCAQFHCDQHVIKMILESVQLLCTALNKKGFQAPYRSTHTKHPCVLWVESSYDNFLWLARLALLLNDEYRYRYSKSVDHASIKVLHQLNGMEYERHGLTPFAQAMPDQYKRPGDAVQAYRNFYLGEKMRFATWSRRPVPYWITSVERHRGAA